MTRDLTPEDYDTLAGLIGGRFLATTYQSGSKRIGTINKGGITLGFEADQVEAFIGLEPRIIPADAVVEREGGFVLLKDVRESDQPRRVTKTSVTPSGVGRTETIPVTDEYDSDILRALREIFLA